MTSTPWFTPELLQQALSPILTPGCRQVRDQIRWVIFVEDPQCLAVPRPESLNERLMHSYNPVKILIDAITEGQNPSESIGITVPDLQQ